MSREAKFAKIAQLLSEVGVLKKEVKRRAMIFQCEEKERVAIANGLPFDAYHELSYAAWTVIRETYHATS